MKITIPENVEIIIKRLIKGGYSAYVVGGCVRDSIMGAAPHDWDICTSAMPEETLNTLGSHNVIDSGLKHGTVTVNFGGSLFEITTFRTDGVYLDNRRPESVTFVRSLKEDLSRRDFTINAIAYNHTDGICDYFGGMEDIRNKIIRCVGNPDKRFNEDALRILRALRFASKLGFEIEKYTSEAVHKNAGLLRNISAERIASELIRILNGEYVEKILTDYSDVIAVVIPEIIPMIGFEQRNPHHIYDVWGHTVKVIAHSPHGKILRLAALFHDIGKPECYTIDEKGTGHFHGHPKISAAMAEKIMYRLKLDKKTISDVIVLIEYHDKRPPAEPKNVRRLLSKIGTENFKRLMELKKADAKGQNPDLLNQKLDYIAELERICEEETADGKQFTIKSLQINGNDLMRLGIKEGRQIGLILKYLLSLVIDGAVENEYHALVKEAAEYHNKYLN